MNVFLTKFQLCELGQFFRLELNGVYACVVMVRTRAAQLLPQLLIEQFDTLLTKCRRNEYMHEVVWFTKQ